MIGEALGYMLEISSFCGSEKADMFSLMYKLDRLAIHHKWRYNFGIICFHFRSFVTENLQFGFVCPESNMMSLTILE